MWPIMQTPNRATMTVIGLFNWDDSLFENMALPDGVDNGLVVVNILDECGNLEVMYPDWDFMQNAIAWWSAKELPTWEKIKALADAEYDPIENYNRTENEVEQEEEDAHRSSFSQSSTNSFNMNQNNTINKVAGINTDTMANQSGSDGNTSGQGQTSGAMDGTQKDDINRHRNRSSNIHGNIGVTTTQQMMEQELGIAPKINIVDYIVNAFKQRFCLLVY